MRYAVLLRGINVGGKNKVPMAQLKRVLENAGLTDVVTYINSGNVAVSSNLSNERALQSYIEPLLKTEFGFPVKALVKSRENYLKIVNSIPQNFTNDTDMKCDVMFLWHNYTAAEAVAKLPAKEAIDTIIATHGAIIWAVDRTNVTRSGMIKLVGTDLYAHMTIRNCNTARKLAAILAT